MVFRSCAFTLATTFLFCAAGSGELVLSTPTRAITTAACMNSFGRSAEVEGAFEDVA